MANTITTQVLNNGPRNLTLKITIVGDASGDESSTLLVDVSEYGVDAVRVDAIDASLNGFSVDLEWDATSNVDIYSIPDGDSSVSFCKVGGIVNNAGDGKTGDIDITTTGLGAETGSILLHLVKK